MATLNLPKDTYLFGVHFRFAHSVVLADFEGQRDCMVSWKEKQGCEVSRLLLSQFPAGFVL